MAKNKPIINLILQSVGMAMGVAVVVMSILGNTDTRALITLLGIGLLAIGLDALNRK